MQKNSYPTVKRQNKFHYIVFILCFILCFFVFTPSKVFSSLAALAEIQVHDFIVTHFVQGWRSDIVSTTKARPWHKQNLAIAYSTLHGRWLEELKRMQSPLKYSDDRRKLAKRRGFYGQKSWTNIQLAFATWYQ